MQKSLQNEIANGQEEIEGNPAIADSSDEATGISNDRAKSDQIAKRELGSAGKCAEPKQINFFETSRHPGG